MKHSPLIAQDLPLHQTATHASALRRLGVRVIEAQLPNDGSALTVLRRAGPIWLAHVPRGPVWPDGRSPARDDLRALRAALPRPALLILSPDRALPRHAQWIPLITGQHIAEWDLTPDPATLRGGLHQKWRNRLRRAEDAGLRVQETTLPPDPDHWLLRAAQSQARARGYRLWPNTLTAHHAALAPQSARLFTAGPARAPMAAMLFFHHGPRATYHIGWTGDAGRAAHAHSLILWQAALRLRARGAKVLELGTLDTDHAAPLARFKLGTGARPRALGATGVAL